MPRIFDQPKFTPTGPFLLKEITETSKGNLILKLLGSEHRDIMDTILMAFRKELSFKERRNKDKQEPFSYEYHPETLSFTLKPIGTPLGKIRDYMLYFILNNAASENINSPRHKKYKT